MVGNFPTEEMGMVNLQVIVKHHQVLVNQVGFKVLSKENLYDGPGFERNTIF